MKAGGIFMPKRDMAQKGARPVTPMPMEVRRVTLSEMERRTNHET